MMNVSTSLPPRGVNCICMETRNAPLLLTVPHVPTIPTYRLGITSFFAGKTSFEAPVMLHRMTAVNLTPSVIFYFILQMKFTCPSIGESQLRQFYIVFPDAWSPPFISMDQFTLTVSLLCTPRLNATTLLGNTTSCV